MSDVREAQDVRDLLIRTATQECHTFIADLVKENSKAGKTNWTMPMILLADSMTTILRQANI